MSSLQNLERDYKFDNTQVRESNIPLEAIYNSKIEKIKKFEFLTNINPCALNLTIEKPNNSDKLQVRIVNLDMNLKIDHIYDVNQTKKVYGSFKESELRNHIKRYKFNKNMIHNRRKGINI